MLGLGSCEEYMQKPKKTIKKSSKEGGKYFYNYLIERIILA
jgi:hypothetical protein